MCLLVVVVFNPSGSLLTHVYSSKFHYLVYIMTISHPPMKCQSLWSAKRGKGEWKYGGGEKWLVSLTGVI